MAGLGVMGLDAGAHQSAAFDRFAGCIKQASLDATGAQINAEKKGHICL
jgi:hypothetical protein